MCPSAAEVASAFTSSIVNWIAHRRFGGQKETTRKGKQQQQHHHHQNISGSCNFNLDENIYDNIKKSLLSMNANESTAGIWQR